MILTSTAGMSLAVAEEPKIADGAKIVVPKVGEMLTLKTFEIVYILKSAEPEHEYFDRMSHWHAWTHHTQHLMMMLSDWGSPFRLTAHKSAMMLR